MHARLELGVAVEVEFELYGFDGGTPFFATGRSVNVSRRGALARLDREVRKGTVCRVFFGDGSHVRPQQVRAHVVRCDASDGDALVALRFDEPLWRLDERDPEALPESVDAALA